MDVTTTSRQVGHMSSSQFIWLFGNAPAREVARLRE